MFKKKKSITESTEEVKVDEVKVEEKRNVILLVTKEYIMYSIASLLSTLVLNQNVKQKN